MEGSARKMRKRMLCDLSCCSCQKCKRYRDNDKDSGVAINFERWNACSRSNQPSEDMHWNPAHSDDKPWRQPQSGDRLWSQMHSDDRPWRQSQSDDKQWSPSQSDDRSKFQIRKGTMDVNLPVDAQTKANGRKPFEADNPLPEPDLSNLPIAPNPNFMPTVQSIARGSIRSNLPNFIKNSINTIKAIDSKESTFVPSLLKKLNANDVSRGGESQNTSFCGILCDTVRAMAFFLMLTLIFWLSAALYLKDLLVRLFYAKRTTQLIVLSLVLLLTLNLCFQVMMRKRTKSASAIRASQKVKQTSSCKDKTSPKTAKPRASSDVPTQPFSPCNFLKRNLPRQTGGACPEKKEEEKKSTSFLSYLRGPRCRTNCPPGAPKTYSFCAKFAENCPQRQAKKHRRYKKATKAVNTPMTDCQGKEIYKIYEKHSYPLDMKFPPAPFIYIRDCIFRRMCPRSPEEAEREDCG